MNGSTVVAGAVGVPLALIVGFSVSSAHAGADTVIPAGSGSFISSEVAIDALAEETSDFDAPLPEGVVWTTLLGIDEPDNDVKVRVQPSFVAATAAATFWLCAWEDARVSRTNGGDKDGAAEALNMVNSFTSLDVYRKNFVDPTAGWRQNVADPAIRGDLSGVQTELTSGCALYFDAQKLQ